MSKFFFCIFIIVACRHARPSEQSENLLQQEIPKPQLNEKVYHKQLDSIKLMAKEGDIIFRSGTDIESDIIRNFSKNDKLFSHCGIVLNTDSGLRVTHILGGSSNPAGSILKQTFEDFFIYPANNAGGIYSIQLTKTEIEKIKAFIDSVQKQGVRFDLKFNLFTKDKLYCTELLIDAFTFARGQKKLFTPTIYDLFNTKYSMLCNKGKKFVFYPIDAFQHHKNLKEKAIFLFPNFNR